MNILEVIFYNYTLWFQKVFLNKQKIINTSFMISGMVIILPLCVGMDTFTSLRENNYHTAFIFGITILIYTVLYFKLLHKKKYITILEAKPLLFHSETLSVLIVFLLTTFAICSALWRGSI